MSTKNLSMRAEQQGFTLIELMVAMLTGMTVVAALMASYFAIYQSNRHGKAMSQVTEDASVAMNVLRNHLSLAGYSRPVGPAPLPATGYMKAYTGAMLAGCDGNFTNQTVTIDTLGCVSVNVANTASDVIAVAYEADTVNSIASGGVPLDCLGNTFAQVAGPPAYYLAYHRFYVANSAVSGRKALYCLGPGNAAGQALVENIVDLQVLYGRNVIVPVPNELPRAIRYVSASQLAGGVTTNIANALGGVVSVRLCLVVSSEEEVLDAPTPYRNCVQTLVTPTDKRVYKTFYSTVVLNNRLGVLQ